jgi:hypothetical protein
MSVEFAREDTADAECQVLLETAGKGFEQEQLMAIMHQVCAFAFHVAVNYSIKLSG